MSRETIDWSKLQPYRSSKNKSLEQLIFQIANRLYGDAGDLWPIDDSGGGDGVEFFLIPKSGKELGWQVKFYEENGRLTGNRKTKIVGSLKKSIKEHPKLSKWILCTNSDFTPTERKWFINSLKSKIPKGRKIKLEHWGFTRIHSFLNEPGYGGIKSHFFSNLELDQTWFQNNFEKFFKPIESKFDAELHTQDSELQYYYIAPLLANKTFKDRLGSYLRNYDDSLDSIDKELEEMETYYLKGIEWEEVRPEFMAQVRAFTKLARRVRRDMERFLTMITANQVYNVMATDCSIYSMPLEKSKKEFEEVQRKKDIRFASGYELNPVDQNRLNRAIQLIHGPSYYASKVIEEVKYFFEHSAIAKTQYLHVLGKAGIGKTHLSVALAKDYVDKGFPVIFVPAYRFNDANPIEQQLLQLLDIHSGHNFSEFLEELQLKGRIENIRIPIIFDGLNESLAINGGFNKQWEKDIAGIELQVGKHPNLALLTTCRASYKTAIWDRKYDAEGFHETYGFTDEEDVKLLLDKYFKHYRIITELTSMSFEHFRRPLFVKIFCEVKNPSREKDVHVTLGIDSIYDIFLEFINGCDSRINARLTEFYGPESGIKKVATQSLPKIGKLLWENDLRAISFDAFKQIMDPNPGTEYPKSKANALILEELLLIRNWRDGEEWVGFTHDLMAGYTVASYLIEEYGGKILELLTGVDFHRKLLRKGVENRDPFQEDIIECLCALLPMKKGIYFHDIIPKEKAYLALFNTSVLTMFSLSPQYVKREQGELIKRIFNEKRFRITLLRSSDEILLIPEHPFNIEFWSERLMECTMPDRDILWSEHIRGKNVSFFKALFTWFERICKSPEQLEGLTLGKCHLAAKYLMWTLSSTVGLVKKGSTRSLYWYGRKYPKEIFELFKTSLTINDPTVFEQMSFVMYGVVLAKQYDFFAKEFLETSLRDISRFIFDNLFAEEAPFSTTNILTRDYTLSTLSAALSINPDFLTEAEKEKIVPPFATGGIRKWLKSKDKNEKEYRDGNSYIDYFFQKDRMPELGFGKEYNPTKEYKDALAKIRWRGYQLGYNFRIFKDVDKWIAHSKHYGEDHVSTKKYGEKYTLIAFYELLGLLNDQSNSGRIRYENHRDDPTYPEHTPGQSLITEDFLLDKSLEMKKWLKNKSLPSIEKYLVCDHPVNLKGKWVLLFCSHDQHDKITERNVYTHVEAFVIHKKDLEFVRTHLDRIRFSNELTPANREAFADEAPRSALFTRNGFFEVPIEIGQFKRRTALVEEHLFHNGKRMPKHKEGQFWDMIRKKYGIDVYQVPGKGYSSVRFISHGRRKVQNPIDAEMKKHKLECRKIHVVNHDLVEERLPLNVFAPQIRLKHGMVLSKEICEQLDLVNRPQSNRLFERSSGGIASVYDYAGEEGYHNYQKFHLIRKDLLDKYLKSNDLILVWNIWGERQYLPYGPKERKDIGVDPWTRFGKNSVYAADSHFN